MKTLNKVAEDLLINALSKVADQVTEDDDPNEAIAKTASELKIPHGHVHLLVKAYNTAKTTTQRQATEDLWSKSASFPLADTAKVLDFMYPEKVKSASERHRETTVSDEYLLPPSWVKDFDKKASKTEAIDWKMVDKPAPLPREEQPFIKALGQIKRAEQEIEESRCRASYAFDMSSNLLEDIKDYFKTAGAEPFDAVYLNSLKLHGNTIRPIFEQVLNELPYLVKKSSKLSLKDLPIDISTAGLREPTTQEILLSIEKQGSSKWRPATAKVYGLVSECLELSEAYNSLREDYETKEANLLDRKIDAAMPYLPSKEASAKTPEELLGKQAAATNNGPGFWASFLGLDPNRASSPKGLLGRAQSIPEGLKRPEPKSMQDMPTLSKVLNPMTLGFSGRRPITNNLASYIDTIPGMATNPDYRKMTRDVDNERLRDKYKAKFEPKTYPDMDNQLDTMHQESVLTDLLSSDDVLSQRNPHDVLQAYSSLRQIAPRASSNKETLRALLRDRIERGNQIDPFNLDMLIKIEKNLRGMDSNRQQSDDDK